MKTHKIHIILSHELTSQFSLIGCYNGLIQDRKKHRPLTPQDFVSKWKRVTAREKQTYQEHFIDLSNWWGINVRPTCLDLAHKRLDKAVFAAYGWKSDLGMRRFWRSTCP